jgi:hypothetical protein
MAILRAVPAPAARARAASFLVALARAGYVKDADLRALGRVILGRDPDAPRWRLPGVGKVRVRAGVVAGYLRAALALAFTPRRVRIGTRWLKDGMGRADGSCIPADLPPGNLAMWLRAATLGLLRAAVTDRDRPMREEHAPEGFEASESPLASDYTNRIAMGPEEDLIARETLAALLALPRARPRRRHAPGPRLHHDRDRRAPRGHGSDRAALPPCPPRARDPGRHHQCIRPTMDVLT